MTTAVLLPGALVAAAVLARLVPERLVGAVVGLAAAGLAVSLALLVAGWWSAPDPLAAWFYGISALLAALSLWYAVPYLRREAAAHHWQPSRVRAFAAGLLLFVASLLALALLTNFLGLWVAVEVATLSSVFLTGVSEDRRATEAAWKYLVVTETGGFAALVGTVLVLSGLGIPLDRWSSTFPPPLPAGTAVGTSVFVGGLLALVGYATKAGLAPFHTWLPDAHGEAPAPVSALLSGLKLAGAALIMWRLFHLVAPTAAGSAIREGFILLGLASLVVAAAFAVTQTDLKRLWAYSSIEHLGLVSLGMGFGGIALVGAMFHIWTHGVNKALLFHNAGTVRLLYGTSDSRTGARGLLLRTPWTGGLLALGAASIVGLPPFAPFWSEWLILVGGFQHPAYRLADVVALGLLVVVFAGVAWRIPAWLWTPGPVEARTTARPARLSEPFALLLPGFVLAAFVLGGIGVPVVAAGLWQHLVQELLGSA
ncbi:MAG: nitroreductase family protein [Actinomycetia bacterium]|nr:nitroreductase family protein [Actinomycetes bacterium]